MNTFLRSWQWKTAINSAFTSLAALAVFCGVSYWRVSSQRQEAIDRDLSNTGLNLAFFAQWEIAREDIERFLLLQVGQERARGCIFAVSPPTKDMIKSDRWPSEIEPREHTPSTERLRYKPPSVGPPPFLKGLAADLENIGTKDNLKPSEASGPLLSPKLVEIMHTRETWLSEPVLKSASGGGRRYRLGAFRNLDSGTVLHLGFDEAVFAPELLTLASSFWLGLPVVVVVVACGAWLTARRGLKPVRELTAAMTSISPNSLDSRLDATDRDLEFHGIVMAYNDMLSRLERSFQQAHRFSADASHELKTPLAVMRGTLEAASSSCANGSREQATYGAMLEEVDHLLVLVDALLLLARADAGKLQLSLESLSLKTWLQPLLEDASLMCEDRGIALHERIETQATVMADAVLLYRALHNLFRNAVVHNQEGGHLWLRVSDDSDHVCLRIANTGRPIPEDERELVFVRFRRGRNAGGSGEGRGLGIGLSLTREIVVGHGGKVELLPVPANGNVEFQVCLPKA